MSAHCFWIVSNICAAPEITFEENKKICWFQRKRLLSRSPCERSTAVTQHSSSSLFCCWVTHPALGFRFPVALNDLTEWLSPWATRRTQLCQSCWMPAMNGMFDVHVWIFFFFFPSKSPEENTLLLACRIAHCFTSKSFSRWPRLVCCFIKANKQSTEA